MADGQEVPREFDVFFSEAAQAEIEAAYFRLMAATSLEFADRWQDSLVTAIRGLKLFPRSHPLHRKADASGPEVRRLLHKLGRVAYQVIYSLADADDDGELDTVYVLHVRHAAEEG